MSIIRKKGSTESDYNIFGKSIRIMMLPLAELGTTTEAAVWEKMVGGINYFGSNAC